METLFRKHFWAVHAVGIVAFAILAAAVFNTFLSAALATFSVPRVSPAPAVASIDDAPPRPFVPADLFGDVTPPAPPDPCADVTCEEGERCNTVTGECEPDEVDEELEDAIGPGDGRCVETDLAVVLAGTVVSGANPLFSLAILHDPAESRTRFARLGTVILGEAEVIEIRRNLVTIRRDGVEECLRPGTIQERQQRQLRAQSGGEDRSGRGAVSAAPQRTAPSAARAAAPAAPRQADRPASLEERIQGAVQQTSPNEFNVERDVLQEVMNNQSLMQQQAPQATPTYRDGRPAGFRLTNVRNDSMFGRLGVRNGDILRSVNGQTIDSPQRAMALYEGLMSQSEIRIEVERRGRTQTLTYRIR